MNRWQSVKLLDVSSLITSGSRNWSQFYSNSGQLFVRMVNLRRDAIQLNMTATKRVQLKESSTEGTRTATQPGDILMSITAELGKIGYVEKSLGDAYVSQHLALIRVDAMQVNSKWLAYYLSTSLSRYRLNQRNDAGSKAGLNLTSIRNFSIILPSISEQLRIVAVLEVWDEYLEKLERNIFLKERLKQGLLRGLMSGVYRLSGFSGAWIRQSIKDATCLIKDGSHGTHKNVKNGVPLLSAKDIRYGEVDLNNKPRTISYDDFRTIHKTYRLADGDVLLTIVGTLGRVAQVKDYRDNFTFQRSVAILRFNDRLHSRFMYYLICGEKFQNELVKRESKGAQGGVYLGEIAKIKVDIPSLEEQSYISDVLDVVTTDIELLKLHYQQLKRQKKYLLYNLTTGKIKTPEYLTMRGTDV